MPPLTVPDSTSVGLTRLGRPASQSADDLGPLSGLLGTWFGTHGWELIAVPTFANGREGFRLIVRPYVETLTFSNIGAPVPNRGGTEAGDMFVTGLLYETRISDLETNEPLHLENGMWFYLGEQDGPSIARAAAIPHGDSFLALGNDATAPGGPQIPDASAVPDAGPKTPLGYLDVYHMPMGEFQPGNANATLTAAIAGQDFAETTTLSVSTADGGTIGNIPFVTRNANVTQFTCTYWLETIHDPETGDHVQQLQYSQQANLEFLPQFGNPDQPIMWPHVNVNTLRKQ